MKRFTCTLITNYGLLLSLLLTTFFSQAQEVEYFYDHNGNLVQDLNKGLKSIRYNHLNLVEQVELEDGRTLTYRYDASGVKLSKTVTPTGGGIPTTTHYLGGVEYEAQQGSPLTLQLLAHDEGRVTKGEEGAFHYEYHLKDHLGNVRVSFEEDALTHTAKLLQRDGYYPFGAQHPGVHFSSGLENKYGYNGKEREKEEDWLNYGARMYDPWKGRWEIPDELSEKYEEWSPYAYVLNNPISNIDPDGKKVVAATQASKDLLILAPLADREHKYINFDKQGYIDANQYNRGKKELGAVSMNYAVLGELINNPEITYNFQLTSKVTLMTPEGRLVDADFAQVRGFTGGTFTPKFDQSEYPRLASPLVNPVENEVLVVAVPIGSTKSQVETGAHEKGHAVLVNRYLKDKTTNPNHERKIERINGKLTQTGPEQNLFLENFTNQLETEAWMNYRRRQPEFLKDLQQIKARNGDTAPLQK